MAFYYTGDQQVRLRFSRFAEEVIQNDMFMFNESKENTFLNKVIKNFYPDASASIHKRLNSYRYELNNILPETDSKSQKEFFDALIAKEKDRLGSLSKLYESQPKGNKSKPFRLQNDIYSILTDDSSDLHENLFYPSLSGYLRTLIEEYAHEPYIKREQIFFKEIFDTIHTAIASKQQLLIKVSNGICYHTLPYQIMSDPLSTTSYLTGFSYEIDDNVKRMYPVSYKISRINNIKIEKSRSGYIHPKDELRLNAEIAEKGVQFLISKYQDVKVRFTKQGLSLFNRQLHLRPTPIDKVEVDDSFILTFNCSMDQARFYFFKFGSHAEVLEPVSLREEFLIRYKEAMDLYLK